MGTSHVVIVDDCLEAQALFAGSIGPYLCHILTKIITKISDSEGVGNTYDSYCLTLEIHMPIIEWASKIIVSLFHCNSSSVLSLQLKRELGQHVCPHLAKTLISVADRGTPA